MGQLILSGVIVSLIVLSMSRPRTVGIGFDYPFIVLKTRARFPDLRDFNAHFLLKNDSKRKRIHVTLIEDN